MISLINPRALSLRSPKRVSVDDVRVSEWSAAGFN